MTPKEKADKLISAHEGYIESNCNQSSRQAHYKAAVRCAIITADTVEDTLTKNVDFLYWEQVKIYLDNILEGDDIL